MILKLSHGMKVLLKLNFIFITEEKFDYEQFIFNKSCIISSHFWIFEVITKFILRTQHAQERNVVGGVLFTGVDSWIERQNGTNFPSDIWVRKSVQQSQPD